MYPRLLSEGQCSSSKACCIVSFYYQTCPDNPARSASHYKSNLFLSIKTLSLNIAGFFENKNYQQVIKMPSVLTNVEVSFPLNLLN